MRFPLMAHKSEPVTELCVELIRTVAPDREPAALVRSIFCEGSNDNVSSWLDRAKHGLNVRMPIFRNRQEVKHRTVVPHVIGMARSLEGMTAGPSNAWAHFPCSWPVTPLAVQPQHGLSCWIGGHGTVPNEQNTQQWP